MSGGNPKIAAELPYRRGVGAMLFNGEGKVFIGRRFSVRYPNSWQMPQGGIDEGETPLEAARRELLEEVGTDKAEPVAEIREWLSYDLPVELVSMLWGGRYFIVGNTRNPQKFSNA